MSSIGQGSISIDDSTRIGENAQDTANKVAGNVNDINSDNKLTPTEKLKLKQEYDKDSKLYAIDVSQLQSAGLPTAELDSAMSNLTNFVTPLFKEMNRTSTVDRGALDSVFTTFATADKNASQAFVNKVQQAADDAKKAGDDAKQAGEEAQEAGQEAKASAEQAKTDATQAKADALTAQQKAQSSIDQLNAHLPDIDTALSTANLVKQDVTKLSDTTEQYHNEYTTGIQNVISTVDNLKIGGRNLYLNSKAIKDNYGIANGATVTVEPFDSTTNMWHIIAKQGSGIAGIYLWDYAQGKIPDNSSWAYSVDIKGVGNPNWLGIEDGDHNPVKGTVNSEWSRISQTGSFGAPAHKTIIMYFDTASSPLDVYIKLPKLQIGTKATDWSPAPEDLATSTEIDQLNNAIKLKANSSDVTSQINVATKGIQSEVDNKVSGLTTQINQTSNAVRILNANAVSQSDITASINNIHLGVKNADGSTSTFNMNGNTILMDTAQTIINGKTSILDGTIGTAKIANAAINTAQIADGAINNAKIANAAINDAKISNLNGNKIVAGSITANKINVDDLIANGINTKTLTAVNLNASTLTTPQIDLGFNGTFTESFDYTQDASMFLPKKNNGTLTFNHGVLQSKGTMQTYVSGQWGGISDNYTFQSGISNSQWTEVAPGYIKLDLFNPNNPNMVERTYVDATGYYYKSGNGIASYLGNVLQTSQVQTPSLIGKYIGPSAGVKLLQIGNNGNDYGLQIGNYGGGEGVLSDFIYNVTNSGSANIHITENGRLTRSTSASKYKYNIKNPDIETTLGDRLLNVRMATWNDKRAVDSYAEQLSTGEEREKSSIDKYYGLIAEQLRDAGLDMFISYGKNHEIEGIQYDRAWVPLLSVIRRLNDKVNEYELRLSKLEGANK